MAFYSQLLFATKQRKLIGPHCSAPPRSGIGDANCKIPAAISGAPELVWKVNAGQGYAGPVVAGNDVVLFERVGENDVVRLLKADSGKEVWRRELKAGYRGGIDSDKGPRSVPSILAETILVYSAAGDLTLLQRKDGTVKWTRALEKGIRSRRWLLRARAALHWWLAKKAIAIIGGKTAGVVCVSLSDGKTIWNTPALEASYASPILLPASAESNRPQSMVIAPGKQKTLALDLEKGSTLWSFPFGQRGPTVNAATPVVTSDGNLFVTSSYDIGSLLVKPSQGDAKTLYKGSEISSQYSTPVVMEGKIFGSDGREDGGGGAYKCLQEKDGKLIWEQPNMPICHTIGAESRVLVVGIGGEIWALDGSASAFGPLWSTNLPRAKYRAIPALSGDRLFTRTSNGSGDTWVCFQFATKSPN